MVESGTMAPPVADVGAAGTAVPAAFVAAAPGCSTLARVAPAFAVPVPVVATTSAPAAVRITCVSPVGGAGAAGAGAPMAAIAAAAAVVVPVLGTDGATPTTLLALMKIPFSESGLSWYFGSTSITTKYWFISVYIVETSRCPNAS